MSVNNLSVGKDIVISFNGPNGPVKFDRVKMFSSKQKTSNRETAALDGVNRHVNIPMGWEGSFEAERVGNSIDEFFQILEDNYYAGRNIPTLTITETITEANGSLTQYQYIGVVLTLDSAGDWKADDYVTQKITFSSEKRKRTI